MAAADRMRARPSPPLRTHLRVADVRGVAQLAAQATAGVTTITEGVHQSVLRTLGARDHGQPGTTSGITGLVYRSVHGVTRLVGHGLDRALAALEWSLGPGTIASSSQRESVIAALNGVLGDRLVAINSPLATPMRLTLRGATLALDDIAALRAVGGKVLLLVHGLCMNDAHWHTGGEAHRVDHGATLASALGYTPLYLCYNSGLHTSQNGRELSALLESVVARWPVAVDDIGVVAHSMGGLVIRSAHHYGTLDGCRWPALLRHVAFLGTPHHGAPLERAGNRIDVILGSTPFTAPFAALGRVRSAGITDLRYGHVVDDDWSGRDRFRRAPDLRHHVPLPAGVACHAVAATRAGRRSPVADRLVGDGLVPVPSALGEHADARRCLSFDRTSRWVTHRTNHMQLLSSRAVTRQLVTWFSQPVAPRPTTDAAAG